MKPSSYYYGPDYEPTQFRERSVAEYLWHKVHCGQDLLKSLPSHGAQTKAVANAIEDNMKLIDELFGKHVEFYEPGDTREYTPTNYLED